MYQPLLTFYIEGSLGGSRSSRSRNGTRTFDLAVWLRASPGCCELASRMAFAGTEPILTTSQRRKLHYALRRPAALVHFIPFRATRRQVRRLGALRSGLIFVLTHNLRACRLTFLSAAHTILSRGLSSHDALVLARLAKTVLPLVTILLGDQTEVPREEGATSSRKGKKRARAYEGDELLKTGRDIICHTVVEGQTILAAVQGKTCSWHTLGLQLNVRFFSPDPSRTERQLACASAIARRPCLPLCAPCSATTRTLSAVRGPVSARPPGRSNSACMHVHRRRQYRCHV
jgi:hypothetical protein